MALVKSTLYPELRLIWVFLMVTPILPVSTIPLAFEPCNVLPAPSIVMLSFLTVRVPWMVPLNV